MFDEIFLEIGGCLLRQPPYKSYHSVHIININHMVNRMVDKFCKRRDYSTTTNFSLPKTSPL